MFEMGLYFIACYVAALFIYFLLKSAFAKVGQNIASKGHHLLLRSLSILLVIVFIILPIVPYILVEIRTHRYTSALLPAVKGALIEIDSVEQFYSLKVLRYDQTGASVYVVTPCYEQERGEMQFVAEVVELAISEDQWVFTGDYSVVWSDRGSASGNIFPPYPSKGDSLWIRNLFR